MYQFIFVQFLTITALTAFEQHDYMGKWERLEVAYYDKRYVQLAKTVNFKYNRTQALTNITLVYTRDYGNELQVKIQAYKFASNEYRLFPITLNFNLCEAIRKNDFGIQDYYNCGNMTKCPMVKGHFLICNYLPTYSKFPPHIPQGKYQLDLKYFYHSIQILHLQGFSDIIKIENLKFE